MNNRNNNDVLFGVGLGLIGMSLVMGVCSFGTWLSRTVSSRKQEKKAEKIRDELWTQIGVRARNSLRMAWLSCNRDSAAMSLAIHESSKEWPKQDPLLRELTVVESIHFVINMKDKLNTPLETEEIVVEEGAE